MPKIDLASLAGMVQQYISRKYAAALIDRTKVAELKAYIAQYLYDTGFTVDGYTEKTLADRLYSEMAEYANKRLVSRMAGALCETCIKAKNLYSVLRVDRATYPAEVRGNGA